MVITCSRCNTIAPYPRSKWSIALWRWPTHLVPPVLVGIRSFWPQIWKLFIRFALLSDKNDKMCRGRAVHTQYVSLLSSQSCHNACLLSSQDRCAVSGTGSQLALPLLTDSLHLGLHSLGDVGSIQFHHCLYTNKLYGHLEWMKYLIDIVGEGSILLRNVMRIVVSILIGFNVWKLGQGLYRGHLFQEHWFHFENCYAIAVAGYSMMHACNNIREKHLRNGTTTEPQSWRWHQDEKKKK